MTGKTKILGAAVGLGMLLSAERVSPSPEKLLSRAPSPEAAPVAPVTQPNTTTSLPPPTTLKKFVPKPTTTTSTLPQPEVTEIQDVLAQTLPAPLGDENIQTLAITPNATPRFASIIISAANYPECAGLFVASRPNDNPQDINVTFSLYGNPDILTDPQKIDQSRWNDLGHSENGMVGFFGEFAPDDATSIQQTISYMASTLTQFCVHLPEVQAYSQSDQDLPASTTTSNPTPNTP